MLFTQILLRVFKFFSSLHEMESYLCISLVFVLYLKLTILVIITSWRSLNIQCGSIVKSDCLILSISLLQFRIFLYPSWMNSLRIFLALISAIQNPFRVLFGGGCNSEAGNILFFLHLLLNLRVSCNLTFFRCASQNLFAVFRVSLP